MKKSFLISLALGCLANSIYAQNRSCSVENDSIVTSFESKQLEALTPTYLDGVYADNGWWSNWFVSVHGGVSGFAGTPSGCGDFTDHVSPALQVGLGKWFTPAVGGRVSYQGMKFKDLNKFSCSYQNLHADFMYNVSSHLRKNLNTLPKWDFVPFLGVGVVHNSNAGKQPFAVSYGVMGRYRISERIHLSAELSGTTAFQNLDGVGKTNRLGDNLFNASIGLTATIGKVGWKRVIDAKPYIAQNDMLINNIYTLREQNEKLSKKLEYDEQALRELRKIMEIEGLLGKYKTMEKAAEESCAYPKNNYSGLNSLRARLANKNWNGKEEDYKPELANGSAEVSFDVYVKEMLNGSKPIGAPIYFFFRVNTDKLVYSSQYVNIKEIARVVKKYGLKVKVIGAADSKTGSVEKNKKLSDKRAAYISKRLKDYGVQEKNIIPCIFGGIDKYSPKEANRFTSVYLYAPSVKE